MYYCETRAIPKVENVGPNDRHFLIIRFFETLSHCQRMFLKDVISQNVAFTHSKTHKDITELKRKYDICMGMGL